MRLWSLDPRLLDRRALVAGWREALLAQKVLAGETRGYRSHPQLVRFRAAPDPAAAIAAFLWGLAAEAKRRGYSFDSSKISRSLDSGLRITVTRGQLEHEWEHLLRKVRQRDPEWLRAQLREAAPAPHPMMTEVPGDVEDWEVR